MLVALEDQHLDEAEVYWLQWLLGEAPVVVEVAVSLILLLILLVSRIFDVFAIASLGACELNVVYD